MTPKFTTACYVRIGDEAKQKEVCEQLERIGYENTWHSPLKNQIIVANTSGTYVDILSVDNTDMINCGSNVALFLDLAGMREDTDKGQWFINESLKKMFRHKDRKFISFYVDWEDGLTNIRSDFSRATATEIINHHKQKGE